MNSIRPRFRQGFQPSASGLDGLSRAIYEVRSGRGINAHVDGGRLHIETTPELIAERNYEFGCFKVNDSSIAFKAGRYQVVGTAHSENPYTSFEGLTTDGSFVVYVKYTYGGSWATNTVGSTTTILHKVDAASLPEDNATQRIIPIQYFTVSGGIVQTLPPQTWIGLVWCYDFGTC